MLINTPVEKHILNGREILVKRDDLMGLTRNDFYSIID